MAIEKHWVVMDKKILETFISEHGLPRDYLRKAERWFMPMVAQLVLLQRHAAHPLIIGINGPQGSGKTTLAALMVSLLSQYDIKAVSLSLDDFYYTRAERSTLAKEVHPLLQTRGVPGTHDITLAVETLKMLQYQQDNVAIPTFNKAQDDRCPKEDWVRVSAVDIVIIEGWCLGALPEDESVLSKPLNRLEQEHDTDGEWRRYVNQQLTLVYPALFNLIDHWVMLKAPSFDCIFKWRQQQEISLRKRQIQSEHIMDDEQLAHFILYYQRITEHMLRDLPTRVNYLFDLDQQREIKHAVLRR